MRVGTGPHTYDWIDNWAKIPETASRRDGWAHNGVVCTAEDQIITYHPGEPRMLVLDRSGQLVRTWETELAEGHGLTLVAEGGVEYLWVVDQGAKRVKASDYQYVDGPRGWQVLKMDLDGRVVARLDRPTHPAYREGVFKPTWAAVNEERQGGNGDIWVTDGYGQSYVHRFTKNGDYRASISGEEGSAGRFSCPHSIWVDPRKKEPELYVADRSNGRIQVYDLDGSFKRSFGTGLLTSPTGFAVHGDFLFVIELRARLAVFDPHDQLVCFIGANDAVCQVAGWPNVKDERGIPSPTPLLEPGKFNSPHGIAADSDGNLYLSEWLIGGRYTKLAKVVG